MSGRVVPSDYRLTFGGHDLVWAGENRPGLPILRWPDGTICEPVTTYFGWSSEIRRVSPGSMKVEAYAIREWLAFMSNARRRWDDPDDGMLRRWRESHFDRVAAGRVTPTRLAHKIACVFEFYRRLPDALPLDGDAARTPFVGKEALRNGVTFPLTSKEVLVGRKGRMTDVWSGTERNRSVRMQRRPTPEGHQVLGLLTWLRSRPDNRTCRRPGSEARQVSMLEAERNWLVGRCMAEAGLRAQETADLGLQGLADALRRESIALDRLNAHHTGQNRHILDMLSGSPEGRDEVQAGLDALSARGRQCLYVRVTGKGNKQRLAPFPIDLVRDLLNVGVWTVRRARLNAQPRVSELPPVLFLSSKTGGPLKSGSVGDLMKAAFRAKRFSGSGHRLRAYFATEMAARLFEECLALNNHRLDQSVENMVLERLAEALGHSRVTTTMRHYIEMAKLRYLGAESRAKLGTLRDLQKALVACSKDLTPEQMRLAGHVVRGLAAAPDGSDLAEMIGLALADAGVEELVPSPDPERPPHLKLVKDEGH